MTAPLIIGLTGSIGMGKSTVAAMFEGAGIPVFDADATVREMQGPGGALVREIEAAFPGSTGPNGVDRETLGAQVFADPVALAKLEALIHPAVAARRAAFLASHRHADMAVFDIPLLFEKGGEAMVDTIVVVSAPASMQRTRVLARPGMTKDKFSQILRLQTPDAEKRRRADHIIDTSGSKARTRIQVERLIARLRGARKKG